MKYLYIFIITVFTSCSTVKLSEVEVVEDINYAVGKINEIHPNAFFYLPKDSFNFYIDRCLQEIHKEKGKISNDKLYRLLNPLIVNLNDAHTKLLYPYQFWRNKKVLPLNLSLHFDDEINSCKAVVKEIFASQSSLRVGNEVLEINGIEICDIVKKIASDKYGMNYNMRLARIDYWYLPGDLYKTFGFKDEFDITYRDENKVIQRLSLKGISHKAFVRKVNEPPFVDKNSLDTIFVDEKNGFLGAIRGNNTAYLYYDRFGGDVDSTLFIKSFKVLESKKYDKLVIDLRHNWGGSTNSYKYILSHLSSDTIKAFSSLEYRFSEDLKTKQYFGNRFSYPKDSLFGKSFLMNEEFLEIVPLLNLKRFKGKLYCLCDAGTFSTASSFCAILKDYRMGELIGESTGGMASTYGNYLGVVLPNSKLTLLVSTGFYTRPNANKKIESVMPDIEYNFSDKDIRQIILDISEL